MLNINNSNSKNVVREIKDLEKKLLYKIKCAKEKIVMDNAIIKNLN